MTRTSVRTAAIAALAFGAGLAAAHGAAPARAAAPPLTPQVIDLAALGPADLPPVSPTMHSKLLVAADGATEQIQIGTVGKHFHADANEVQIVLSGGGTEWLGDKEVALRPGLMLIIPAGTPHGGTTDPNLKLVALKTPPQAPTDTHMLP
jgi:mannose-6-phosphate isomerase-like protein (cupin superfamily)